LLIRYTVREPPPNWLAAYREAWVERPRPIACAARQCLSFSAFCLNGIDPMDPKSARKVARRGLLVLALLPLWFAGGCNSGDGLNRQAVSGTVTLDGKPLEDGNIKFTPTSPEAGTEGAAHISNGKYAFSKSDGPVPGPYRVEISSAKGGEFEHPEGKTPGEVLPPRATELVPEKYNLASQLKATVKAGQTEPIDFPLTSK
jgi:hypothetical protein